MENGVRLLVAFIRSLEENPISFGKAY